MLPRLSEIGLTLWSAENTLYPEKYDREEVLMRSQTTAKLAVEEDFDLGDDTMSEESSSVLDLVSKNTTPSSCNPNFKNRISNQSSDGNNFSNPESPYSMKSPFHYIAILQNKILNIEYSNNDNLSRKGSASQVLASIAHHKGYKYRRFSSYPNQISQTKDDIEFCKYCAGKCVFKKWHAYRRKSHYI